jgi:hypothetical protein
MTGKQPSSIPDPASIWISSKWKRNYSPPSPLFMSHFSALQFSVVCSWAPFLMATTPFCKGLSATVTKAHPLSLTYYRAQISVCGRQGWLSSLCWFLLPPTLSSGCVWMPSRNILWAGHPLALWTWGHLRPFLNNHHPCPIGAHRPENVKSDYSNI